MEAVPCTAKAEKADDAAPVWRKDGFVLRPARQEDAERYYEDNFAPLDPEIARLTGSRPCFSKEEVTGFFKQCAACPDRYNFVLVSPRGRIVGESVINEMDMQLRSANFRLALFHPEACGKGTGSWMIRCTLEFAFQALRLHRLSLDVFSFNQRAIRAYEKAGFRREGVLRDAVLDGGAYADDILMSMLEEEWRALYPARSALPKE